ncbi:alpha/beta hydrolase [Pseudodesulfovibrio sp. F-1]|uniref:Alpha/beta hydrolase n=1 Tax=Pseudodesulfovibrio alkaliphilus TaxID=2661613 RepID=A0A7K1KJI9_9BACT|nr:alpha/beta fold hydrolase [Pseudodesulfovibrio alkaliphilus]MUM76253.1 alpha/beta hydrolase [Pseudodesulfovibrio alkaliphilus]
MPVLPTPDYLPPLPFRSGNVATLYPPLMRRVPPGSPRSQRIETPDGDFLDVDFHPARTGATRRLAIISHGLEGNARRKYVLGMAVMVTDMGLDAACWTQRGCGPEPNRLPRLYHSGETGDLHTVITHCLGTGRYDEVVLIGFSMGGNQILKYLGEAPEKVPPQVRGAAAFSVPCDLSSAERIISRAALGIYLEYFMRGLRAKVRTKAAAFPEIYDAALLEGIDSLRSFDDRYTAPINGFADAEDYYARSSCIRVLDDVRVPALLVNARNDPFLTSRCLPVAQARRNPSLLLEMPRFGGHVGFVAQGHAYWSEVRTRRFLVELLGLG